MFWICLVVLIVTIIFKKKWIAISGFAIDVICLIDCAVSISKAFTVESTEGAEALGEAIGMAMFGPLLVVIVLVIAGLTIAEACLISKYGKKIRVVYNNPSGVTTTVFLKSKKDYNNFLDNYIPQGYQIISAEEVK